MSRLEHRLREQAQHLGFSQVGIAPAEAPASAPYLESWLKEGMHGELAYMARAPERRLDPRTYWPECRSIVALSVVYATRDPEPEPGPLQGRIARYARGHDYHEVLKARLHLLGKWLQQERPGSRYLAVVDTSAVLERAHAARAGLGWLAKNSMLLSRQAGSYTLLSFLLVDFSLEPDSPATAHCGSCTRCLDVCPTGAIVAPQVVDARKCISYLTIELRGAIPVPLRDKLEGWAFGCDLCQEVCPWVQKAGAPELPGPIEALPGRELVDLSSLVLEDQSAFAARWKKSPLKRSRREGLARNAVTLLGRSPDREGAVALLEHAMHDPAPLVRAHAAWSLGEQGGAAARVILETTRDREPEAAVQAECEDALERM